MSHYARLPDKRPFSQKFRHEISYAAEFQADQERGSSMKVLLVAVNAKYIHSNPAVYSLRAYAGEELGQFIEIAEYTINQHTADNQMILRRIKHA